MDSEDKEVLKIFTEIIPIKAISPDSGGEGESKRADYLEKILKNLGVMPKRYDYLDKNHSKRSNLLVKYGNAPKTIWILAHIDTVSEGNISLWKSEPFIASFINNKIYGRGTEDNGIGIVSTLFTLKNLINKKLRYSFGLILAADEELGSEYGIKKLLKENLFRKGDMFIVPDWGVPKGNKIEVAEKSILRFKITVLGKQVHASTPEKGLNALKEASKFALEADDYLHKKYNTKTKIFPEGSTFEMTKHEANVDSVNIISGKEIFYIECRLIPGHDPELIIKDLNKLKKKSRAKINIEVIRKEGINVPTDGNSEIIKLLEDVIKKELNIKPQLVAVGGGTVAKFVRNAGYNAAVWGIGDDTAHQPNEYVRISDIKSMIKIFSKIYLKE